MTMTESPEHGRRLETNTAELQSRVQHQLFACKSINGPIHDSQIKQMAPGAHCVDRITSTAHSPSCKTEQWYKLKHPISQD